VTTPLEEPSFYIPGPYDQPTGSTPASAPLSPIPQLTPAPARRRRTGLVVGLTIGAVVILAAAAVVVVFVVQSAGKMTVHGSMTIRDVSSITVNSDDGSTCAGKDGYDDLVGGAPVNITDSGTATVGLGQLDTGKYDSAHGCVLTWTVSGVPTGKGFYGIAIGHRAAIKIPEAQLHQQVPLTIG